jgi:hypothetical protein
LLLLIPGALWYFTYSRKYRWLNQLVVAVFIGLRYLGRKLFAER